MSVTTATIQKQTNAQRAAGFRELEAEWREIGKTHLADLAAKRAAEFETPRYSSAQINAAIDVEAFQWSQHFDVTDSEQIEARKGVMRANVALGYLDPLLEFLPPTVSILL